MTEGNIGLLGAVAHVVKEFDELGIEYFIGGSIASSVFGEPRQTIDADLVARLLGRHAEPLVQRLQPLFYADLAAIHAAVQNQSCFNLIHLDTMSKVDIFVHWREPFSQSQFARRQKKAIGGPETTEFFFASPEDTILAKLDWFRRGGEVSDRQWRDLLSVLKVQDKALDQTYLTHWASELGVTDLFERALHDAGLRGS